MQQTENLAPHVNEIARALGNKMDPSAIEDELRRYLEYGVPLHQAKRDIVRMHGGSLHVGGKKVADLLPEDRGVELKVKVLTVNPKEITVKGQPKTIWYGYLADESGRAAYTAWKDFNLQPGLVYRLKSVYVKKGFRDGVDVQLGDYSGAEATTEQMEVKDDPATRGGAAGGDAGSRIATERKVKELRDGMGSVTLTARVLDAREKVINTVNGQKALVEGELADETGRVAFSAWEPDRLPPTFKANAVVTIKGAYVRAFRGVPQLNFGQYATIEVLAPDALPPAEDLQRPAAMTLAELESAGGAQGVQVEGVVLEVKKGSGLIFRCSTEGCSRVLQNKECRVHGKQKGTPDLRIKAVLDDGLGAATFFANRQATERILGKSLDECQEMARDAMTTDVVQDELVQKLTARRVLVTGNATSDEFGLQIIASEVTYAPPKDVEAEAERLLARLAADVQEVA
ncbi:MAG TPA: hypothetical protein VNX21_08100 [Candidatus Thermoplasmatota archaeon]|nr:hypothetical protein [Candidatus Thermoplasmatota archaeon]